MTVDITAGNFQTDEPAWWKVGSFRLADGKIEVLLGDPACPLKNVMRAILNDSVTDYRTPEGRMSGVTADSDPKGWLEMLCWQYKGSALVASEPY